MGKAGKKIKVVHIVTRMNTGGVAVLIAEIFRGYDHENFDFTLITGACQVDEEDYLKARNLSLEEITVPSMSRSLNPVKDVLAFIAIARNLTRLKPDIVHTHTSNAGLIGRIAAKVACPTTKVIHTYHGHLLQGYFSKLATHVLVLTEMNLARITDVLISMGNHVMKELLHAGVGKAGQYKVVFPGVAEIISQTKSNEAIEFKSRHANEVICTFVGRLSPIKRCDRIIEIARKAKLAGKPIHFLIIGDGELRQELETASQDLPVSFMGWKSNTEDWLAITDIAILLSDNEAVPLAMIEAGIAGLPVVATNVGSMADVVIDGVNGQLTTTNIDDIAEVIFKLADAPDLRKKMGVAGQALAREKFSTQSMITAHQVIYSQLMQIKA